MYTISRGCLRLSCAILNNSASLLRPLCPAMIKPERFCSRNVEFKNVQDHFDDFENPCPDHELFENIDFDSIVGDDLEMKKKLQVIILELSMKMQTEPLLAPRKLQSKEWRTLLECQTDFHRTKYLKYLYIRQQRKELNDTIVRNQKENLERINESKIDGPLTTSSPLDYCLKNTTLFYRMYDRHVQKRQIFNLALAMMFGEDLVIDCSYEKYMSHSGVNSCARHISYLYANNRASKNPFNLVLCNLEKNSKLMKVLINHFPHFDQDEYFITATEKHYLDLYPAEKLVYMTPHCHTDMEEYEEDSVYILGAYVDVGKYKPVSLAKARKYGVRTARLPLDKYLNWSAGSKLLPFNTCARILNDVKDGACWQYALRHIDIRKQKFQFFDNDIDIEQEQRLAAKYVHEDANRNMLYNLNIRGLYRKNEIDDCSSSDVGNNESEYSSSSANDGF